MYARRLALFCLLSVSTLFGRSLSGTDNDVVVYLKPGNGVSPAALAQTKLELVSLMRGLGVRVGWRDSESSPTSDEVEASLIVGDFRGACSTPSIGNPSGFPTRMSVLAETSITDGHILPFAHINCDTLTRFVGSTIAKWPSEQREVAFGRAIARLLAHEIYHIVMQTREHARAGVAKEHFSINDLLVQRFEFEPSPVAAMFHQQPIREICAAQGFSPASRDLLSRPTFVQQGGNNRCWSER